MAIEIKQMKMVDSKALHIAKKNVKEKLKNFGSMFWTVAFPIMMLLVYKLAFSEESDYMINGLTAFDVEFPGIVVYTIGMATVTSAVMFSMSKKDGTLERIDSMPVSRGNVFLGALISETIFMNLQLVLLFTFGYGILGAHFELAMLPIGYLIAMLYGIGAIGLGLIISSFVKTPEAANGFSMLGHMVLMFVSGSFFPLDNPGVFFTPQYWVKQVYLQLTVVGDSFSDLMYSTSIITPFLDPTIIPIWGGLLIIIAFTALFIAIGIRIFQKKTSL
ncbi:MAG: ABC transporter permease [Candidatus Lokiarchaeota archaeon]|nr:ABC transporter permease [Candidatus Lokiarchaeota archaeon]